MGSVRGKKQEKGFYLTGRCVNEDFSPPSIGAPVSLQPGGTRNDSPERADSCRIYEYTNNN
ncbi:hypothetical protein DRI50_08715 [candidate division KSB1 bacterium]|nr:MAG: hypothetical protein DRI50_08715 [candidate division KSB1 bacterium]